MTKLVFLALVCSNFDNPRNIPLDYLFVFCSTPVNDRNHTESTLPENTMLLGKRNPAAALEGKQQFAFQVRAGSNRAATLPLG
jgi:hypothetical protein